MLPPSSLLYQPYVSSLCSGNLCVTFDSLSAQRQWQGVEADNVIDKTVEESHGGWIGQQNMITIVSLA